MRYSVLRCESCSKRGMYRVPVSVTWIPCFHCGQFIHVNPPVEAVAGEMRRTIKKLEVT